MAKAKTKAAPEPAEPSVTCAVCSATVRVSEYVSHAQTHINAAPAPAAAPTAPPRATLPAYIPPRGAPPYQPPEQQNQQQQITPISGEIPADKFVGGNYLKGSDVPDGQQEVRIRVLRFVIDPRGRSKLVCEIEPLFDKTMWGLNTTNIRALAALGFADLQAVAGRAVVCMVGLAPNPQKNGAMTRSLFVQRVE